VLSRPGERCEVQTYFASDLAKSRVTLRVAAGFGLSEGAVEQTATIRQGRSVRDTAALTPPRHMSSSTRTRDGSDQGSPREQSMPSWTAFWGPDHPTAIRATHQIADTGHGPYFKGVALLMSGVVRQPDLVAPKGSLAPQPHPRKEIGPPPQLEGDGPTFCSVSG
jgi:hypothetical protein